MILILTNSRDTSADIIEEYLINGGNKYFRINAEDFIFKSFTFSIKSNELNIDSKIINISTIKIVWFRKFGNIRELSFYKEIRRKYGDVIANQLINEHYEILHTIIDLFKNHKWLTDPSTLALSKITILKYADEVGLKTPNTQITNQKKDLVKMINKEKEVISKSIFEALFYDYKQNSYSMFTKIINSQEIKSFPILFFPSLIQQSIKKEYEIRVFYLERKCYSMAIFSQNDSSTKKDFRIYNWDKPIRFVPYKLDKSIERKIIELCDKININCCSIDLIKDTKGDYIFLEINQVGEFGMVSYPCDYNLHKEIYKTLLNYDKYEIQTKN